MASTTHYSDELIEKSLSVLKSAQAIAVSGVETGFVAAERMLTQSRSFVSDILGSVLEKPAA